MTELRWGEVRDIARASEMDRINKKSSSFRGWLCCLLLAGLLPLSCAWAQTVTYIHTDMLGSVVAESDAAGNVTKRFAYEPYGAVVGGEVTDGPGYTGHVSDAATGLSYMQQRYMDPQLGLFLSVDPVTAHQQPVNLFNRYRYANGNPYKFKDPDGRIVETVWDVANVVIGVGSAYSNFSQGNIGAGVIDSIGVAIDTTAAVIPVVPAGAGAAIKAARGAERAVDAATGAVGGERAGKAFTRAGKAEVKADNALKNGGKMTCTNCGQATVPAQQSKAGVTPPKNETHVDHVVPQSKGGNGSPDNGQVLCRECNLQKGDKL